MKQSTINPTLFELNGRPKVGESIPLALQHLVAMIMGCIAPSIIVAAAAGLTAQETVLLIQSGLFASGIATLWQVYSPFGRLGSGLPMIFGVSFAYVPVLTFIAGTYGMAALFGAQIIGSFVAIAFGIFLGKLRRFFPAVVTGTVVVTIGLSLYTVAINYMAGGAASSDFGSVQNWAVAFITLAVVIFFNYFTKGALKYSSILLGIIVGYIIAAAMGMVDFSGLANAQAFALPRFAPFGIEFLPEVIPSMIIMFLVNSVQVMGEVSATTSGAMDRLPSDRELSGGVMGNGITSIIGGVFGGLPTSTFGQNVGIVATTKIINKFVFALTAVFILLAGFVPAFGAVLTTIPQCVLGGATLSVFATIAMTGIRLITSEPLTPRNMGIAGISIALGVGIASVPNALNAFPGWVQTLFGSSSVIVATIFAVVLNLIIPKDKAMQAPAPVRDEAGAPQDAGATTETAK